MTTNLKSADYKEKKSILIKHMASGPTENIIMGPRQPLGPVYSAPPSLPGEPRYKTQPNAMNFHEFDWQTHSTEMYFW